MSTIVLDRPLTWQEVAAIADGAPLEISPAAWQRLRDARAIVDALVDKGIHAYGVTTGVGGLSDVIIDRADQRRLSRNLILSHSVGVGPLLGRRETRAIMAAAINNYAHGWSGVTPDLVAQLQALLNQDCVPEVPSQGSVGYLSHMAHISLVLIGEGYASLRGERLRGGEALAQIGRAPLVLGAKEGLSLVNGSPCATGLSALVMERAANLMEWADLVAAMTFEAARGQIVAFDPRSLALKVSPGLQAVGERLRAYLAGSAILAEAKGRQTQDPLSLRTIPHVHGAALDAFAHVEEAVQRELDSVSDNPVVTGTPDEPVVFSEAHAVAPALALAMDHAGIAIAEMAAMAERRLDRLVNPLVSGLPAFLARDSGAESGFMIAQYTAVSLVSENRRLASPASLDGGITSALQEDHLCHPTPSALKALKILDNAEAVLAIEMLAAAQAYNLMPGNPGKGAGTGRLHDRLRAALPPYADDRSLSEDIATATGLVRATKVQDILAD